MTRSRWTGDALSFVTRPWGIRPIVAPLGTLTFPVALRFEGPGVGGRSSGFKGFGKVVGGCCCDSRDDDANDDDGTGDRGPLAFAARESRDGTGDGSEPSSHSQSEPDGGMKTARGDTVGCMSEAKTGVAKGLP